MLRLLLISLHARRSCRLTSLVKGIISSTTQNTTFISSLFSCLLILAGAASTSIVLAESKNVSLSPQPFRIVDLPSKSRGLNLDRALQVPIISYVRRSNSGATEKVDFVGAIHLAEAEYYRNLNTSFRSYDAVLYELVADKEVLPEQQHAEPDHVPGFGSKNIGEDTSSNPVRFIQGALARILGLQFQLEGINYHAKNFIHADLSPSELSEAMRTRGESIPSILLKLFKLHSSTNKALPVPKNDLDSRDSATTKPVDINSLDSLKLDPLKLLLIGPSTEEQRALKAYLAEGIISSEELFKALQDDGGLALIDDRNAAIIKVMREQFNRGLKDLAVFYGVGHLHDLHHRLTEEEGFRMSSTRWLNAWIF